MEDISAGSSGSSRDEIGDAQDGDIASEVENAAKQDDEEANFLPNDGGSGSSSRGTSSTMPVRDQPHARGSDDNGGGGGGGLRSSNTFRGAVFPLPLTTSNNRSSGPRPGNAFRGAIFRLRLTSRNNRSSSVSPPTAIFRRLETSRRNCLFLSLPLFGLAVSIDASYRPKSTIPDFFRFLVLLLLLFQLLTLVALLVCAIRVPPEGVADLPASAGLVDRTRRVVAFVAYLLRSCGFSDDCSDFSGFSGFSGLPGFVPAVDVFSGEALDSRSSLEQATDSRATSGHLRHHHHRSSIIDGERYRRGLSSIQDHRRYPSPTTTGRIRSSSHGGRIGRLFSIDASHVQCWGGVSAATPCAE